MHPGGMRYYPVFLDIAGKPVVIIGGGNIAHQKVVGLLDRKSTRLNSSH